VIAEQLVEKLNTPEARRDLSVSCFKLAHVASERDQVEVVRALLLDGLQQAQHYQRLMPSADADKTVAIFEEQLQALAQEEKSA